MIKFIKIVCVALFLAACGGSETPSMQTASLNIEGMSCAHSCAPTIQEKLSTTEGVKEAKVSFEEKKAVVTFNENEVSKDDLKRAVESIEDGAYKVTSIK